MYVCGQLWVCFSSIVHQRAGRISSASVRPCSDEQWDERNEDDTWCWWNMSIKDHHTMSEAECVKGSERILTPRILSRDPRDREPGSSFARPGWSRWAGRRRWRRCWRWEARRSRWRSAGARWRRTSPCSTSCRTSPTATPDVSDAIKYYSDGRKGAPGARLPTTLSRELIQAIVRT